ncbi:MAG: HlyD family efflux transporter periplasmic adaptor subunit [Anaerolineales bacterium]|nr:HlyD family efflux transporter periplasmic adaptor subunit [Anaerolineales bacterium]
MSAKRLLIGIVIIAVFAIGGYVVYKQFLAPESKTTVSNEPAVTETTDSASIETGANAISAEGRIVPLKNTQLSFQTGGEIIKIFVAEGDAVAANAPLIQLDTADQEIAINQAKAAIAQAVAAIKTAEAGLLTARAGLTTTQSALDSSRARLALLEAGPSEEQIASSQSLAAVAEAGVSQAAGLRDASLEGASDEVIASAEAQLAAAQAQYNAAIRTNQPITQNEKADDNAREQAQLQINVAQANLQSAQAALDQLQAGPSWATQSAANSGVSVAIDRQKAAQANLELLLAGPREEQIAVAKTAIVQTENQLAEAELRVTRAETAVIQAKAALEEAQIGLAAAENDLKERTLLSPFAATIAAILVKEHEVASPGLPVISLADFSKWRIETIDLTELDVVKLEPDLPVGITFKAFPGEQLAGHVSDIATFSTMIRGDVTYVTTIGLDDDRGLPLRWGMSAFVTADGEIKTASSQTPGGQIITTEGLVEPLDFINLSFQTTGEITEILVKEGDPVKKGDALIKLDDSSLAPALDQAQARLASAKVGLTAAQNQVSLATAGVTTAESGVAAAEANLELTKVGPRPEEIAAAEANVQAAESAVTQAMGNRDVALDVTSDADIYTAKAAVDQTYSEMRLLEESYQAILDACFKLPDGGTVCPLLGPEEESTRDQLNAARINYQAAVLAYDAARQGPTPAQQRAASGEVALAIANRDAATAQLALLSVGATPEMIAIAEIGVRQAEAGVESAQAELARAEAAVQQAQAAIVQAQANVDTTQTALDRLTLRAPYDGTISRIDAAVGQLVNLGSPVLVLADFGGWLVKTTDLTELDVASVSEGSAVVVRLDAIPNVSIPGVVTKVALISDSSLGDVVYKAEIKLDEIPDLPVRWGMTAFVEIEPGQ